MEKLDIDWLHREHKAGRRSGRTTEMLANAVGCALVAENDTDIYIVCDRVNQMNIWTQFIEVLREVSPETAYFRNIHRNRPCITIPIGENIVRVMFENVLLETKSEGEKTVDEIHLFDHHWEEELDTRLDSLVRTVGGGFRLPVLATD